MVWSTKGPRLDNYGVGECEKNRRQLRPQRSDALCRKGTAGTGSAMDWITTAMVWSTGPRNHEKPVAMASAKNRRQLRPQRSDALCRRNCRYGGLRWTVVDCDGFGRRGLGTTTCGDGECEEPSKDNCVSVVTPCRKGTASAEDATMDWITTAMVLVDGASEPQPVAMAECEKNRRQLRPRREVMTPCVEELPVRRSAMDWITT
jgi:hypothetical protein